MTAARKNQPPSNGTASTAPGPAQTLLEFDGLPLSHQQAFNLWKQRPGAKHVLKDFYRLTAAYVGQWKQTGIPVSATLVFELLRHRMKHIYTRAERLKVKDAAMDGYALPNNIRPYVARHYLAHKPEHKGLFETRAVGMERSKKRVIVIDSKPKKAT